MRDFVYTAWLQDSSLGSDEEDFHYPALFRVAALTEDAAHAWGDALARSLCGRRSELTFLTSNAQLANLQDPAVAALPQVAYGQVADDCEIAW